MVLVHRFAPFIVYYISFGLKALVIIHISPPWLCIVYMELYD